MMQPNPYVLPKGFLWGAATAAYQIEGAVKTDGRGESIWDRFSHTPGKIVDGSNGDTACDHYHLYREDIAMMKWLGLKAYRFSIAWSRILPDGTGNVNQPGLDFYDRLVDELLAAGIQPWVTLYHWDLPQALQEIGGWANRDCAQAFVDYSAIACRKLGDRVTGWMTHNEPWCAAILSNQIGMHAPGIQDLRTGLQVAHHILLSHGMAVPVIRQAVGAHTQVGIAPNLLPVYPASEKPEDVEAARRMDGYFNRWFLDPLVGRGYPDDMWAYYGKDAPQVKEGDMGVIAVPLDFLGINYYNRSLLVNDPNGAVPQVKNVPDPSRQHTQDREIYPEGLYDTLIRLHIEYPFKAIYITENGAAYPDVVSEDGCVHDPERTSYYQAHFAQAHKAIERGVPLKGFFVWSLMDNFEWSAGYSIRYGFVYTDYPTQKRIVKDSGLWYRDWIKRSSHQ